MHYNASYKLSTSLRYCSRYIQYSVKGSFFMTFFYSNVLPRLKELYCSLAYCADLFICLFAVCLLTVFWLLFVLLFYVLYYYTELLYFILHCFCNQKKKIQSIEEDVDMGAPT